MTSNNPDEQPWDRIVLPQRRWLDLELKTLWDYRDLLVLFIKRDIVTQYKQTILGPIWYIVQPLLTMAIYVLVFGNIARLSTDGIPAPLFYLGGIVLWNYFADCLQRTSATFAWNSHLFGKVYFPRLVLPLATASSGLVKCMIQCVLFWLLLAAFLWTSDRVSPNAWLGLTPLLVLLLATTSLGCGILLSSLTNKYRDLRYLLDFGVQLWMYSTPIIYPLSALSPRVRSWLWWNPLAHIIEAFRFGFLGAGELSLLGLLYSSACAIGMLALGVIVFNRTEQSFVDHV